MAFFCLQTIFGFKVFASTETMKKIQNLFLSGEREQALLTLKINFENLKKEPQLLDEYQNISETFYLEKNQAEYENVIVNLHTNPESVLKRLTEIQIIEKKNGLIDYAIAISLLNTNQCSQLKNIATATPFSNKEKEIKFYYLLCSNQTKELDTWLQRSDLKKPLSENVYFIEAQMLFKAKNYTKAEQLTENELKNYLNPELLMLKTLLQKELKKDFSKSKKAYLNFCSDKNNLKKRDFLYYPNLCKAAADIQEIK